MKTNNTNRAILWAGLIAGTMDILAAFVTNAQRNVTPMRVLRGVASGLLGASAAKGGTGTAILGLFLHFVIAFGAAAVYYAASRKLPVLVRQPIICGALFGIAVYWFMNLIVLPLSAFPYKISYQTSVVLTGLVIHILCVGLPIAFAVRKFSQ